MDFQQKNIIPCQKRERILIEDIEVMLSFVTLISKQNKRKIRRVLPALRGKNYEKNYRRSGDVIRISAWIGPDSREGLSADTSMRVTGPLGSRP